jgi:predicted nuclease of predicted toxin-antitoxin system
MRVKAYIDEDVAISFSQALSNRGVDVITTQDAGNKSLSDAEQLAYAVGEGRAIVTHNRKDFILLYNDFVFSGKSHPGIIVHRGRTKSTI